MDVDSRVTVKISYRNACILNESSIPLPKNDLKGLIAALRDTQQKTNECLTKLTNETGLAPSAEENSDVSDQHTDEEDDLSLYISTTADNENDVSPKRAKLKN